jgi:hypothetical protein
MPKIIDKLSAKITIIGMLCLLVVAGLIYRSDQAPVEAQSAAATFSFIRYTHDQKKPFKLNTLPTTRFGPAWADVVTLPANMVSCASTVPIALCYYSGPNGPAPCNEDGLGIANCTCYEIPSTSQGNKQPYLVDINGILNEDVYLQTVAKCGKEGEKCKNVNDAPVCAAINNNTLIPGADLISTFSLYLEKQMPIHETNCPIPSDYAGCMTAPCKRTGKIDPTTKLPLVQCGCPVYKGPYQVGTATDECVLGGTNVWSAAYNPNLNKTPTPTPGEE